MADASHLHHNESGRFADGLHFGRISGIDIHADWSVIVILWLVAWSLASRAFPDGTPGYPTAWYWVAGAAMAVLFVAGLLAHELAHSVVAIHRGVMVRDIRLWLLGGIATIASEPESPNDEFAIAVAGPAMSAAIGATALIAVAVFAAFDGSLLARAALTWLGTMNLVLAVFNLAPAAPLDGGRLLRAWIWRRTGDRTLAGVRATRAGRRFAIVLIALGLLEFAFGALVSGVWLVFLGWFVFNAARSEELDITLRNELASVAVREVMSPDPITVPSDASVADVLDQFMLTHRCSAFPVVGHEGQVEGLVSLDDVRNTSPADRTLISVAHIAQPLEDIARVSPNDSMATLFDLMAQHAGRRALVFDEDNLVGIVTPTDIAHAVQRAPMRVARHHVMLPPVPPRRIGNGG